MTPSQRLWGERRLPLTTAAIRWFADQYARGRSDEQRRAADISPLYADLHGLTPALFSVGALDPMLDDSLFMSSARWRAAGTTRTERTCQRCGTRSQLDSRHASWQAARMLTREIRH